MKKKLNSKSGSKFQEFKKIILKLNEKEKEKAIKKKLEKQDRPTGYRAKKTGVIVFWGALAFMLLVFIVNFGGNKKNAAVSDIQDIAKSKAVSLESAEFTKSFLSEYFTWNFEESEQEARTLKMGFYTTPGLASIFGQVDEKTWNSSLDRNSAILKDTKYLGDNISLFVFQTNITFEKPSSVLSKQVEELQAGELSPTEQPSAEELGEGSVDAVFDENGILKKIVKKKYVAVQVLYEESANRFIVVKTPSFTHFDESTNVVEIEDETGKLNAVMDSDATEIKEFLNTFFESYSNDSKEKLGYFIEEEQYQLGLNKAMKFESVKEANVYEGKKENEYIVYTRVQFIEPDTNIAFSSEYTIVLKKKEKRYVVKHVNNKEYTATLIKKKIENEAEKKANEIK